MLKKSVIPAAAIILFLSGCQVQKKWRKTTFLYFDTVCEISLLCSEAEFTSAKEKIRKTFEDIETHFSPGVVSLSSPLVIDLYKKALLVYDRSGGSFDITVAPLSRIWGFRDSVHRVPTREEIDRALEKVGMDKTHIENETLILSPGMELDWGGIAKGFGIDLASQSVMKQGIQNGFINAGGDLYCWGKNPDKRDWKIGIKHPRTSGISAVLEITGTGAATTGDYQRFFIQDGVRYHHVFNPKSGYPARYHQSVTVVGPKTLICDALSTALFVSSQPKEIVEKFPEYGAVIIDREENIRLIGKTYPVRPQN
jgi:thiamine biosynthesis lipoprotein